MNQDSPICNRKQQYAPALEVNWHIGKKIYILKNFQLYIYYRITRKYYVKYLLGFEN